MSLAPFSPTTPANVGSHDVVPAGWSSIEGAVDFTPAPDTAPEPEAVPEVSHDLSAVSTRELRVLSNQLYRLLDTDFPPFGIREDYAAVVDALRDRAARAVERSESEKLREKFRDNAVSSRFELFHDGTMVGYVKYDIRSGRIRLLETVVGADYQNLGLEAVLVKEALLSAHRRRLAPVPYCRHAQAFLAENPQFRALIPVG